jgi:SpoVK/Ycf46/Vps4 family AAA+-type ATPase
MATNDGLPIILVVSCEKLQELPAKVGATFARVCSIEAPSRKERERVICRALETVSEASHTHTHTQQHHYTDFSLSSFDKKSNDTHTHTHTRAHTHADTAAAFAAQTAGFSKGSLRDVVVQSTQHVASRRMLAFSERGGRIEEKEARDDEAESLYRSMYEETNESAADAHSHTRDAHAHAHTRAHTDTHVSTDDLKAALDAYNARANSNLGTVATIPNVKWKDIGGLEKVKGEILDTIQFPLENPDLFADGVKRRCGVLLYGPPGTGKTLLAKAVATECGLNFISVKGPELLNMYIGESEKNIRAVFERARAAKPCVLFFDEIDSLAPARGSGSDGGGVMDRVVSQLLTELDGMGSTIDVFVIAATNRPDLLEKGLLRPGRLDNCVYLGVADTDEGQVAILRALTRKFNLHGGLELMDIARQCPFTYTGADFYALCSDAILKSVEREIAALADSKHGDSQGQVELLVTRADFEAALGSLTPSLNEKELARYRQLREDFTNRD